MKKIKFGLKRNSSTILTIIAAIGVIGTAIISAKDTPKAMRRIQKAKKEKGDDLTVVETVVVAAPAYIPTAAVTVTTVVCIFGINAMSKRSQASLASAYALLDRSYKEYRHKTTELFGEDADDKICDAIAQDHYLEKKPEPSAKDLITIYDPYSEEFFESCELDISKAENYINKLLNSNGFVSFNNFYEVLGIDYDVSKKLIDEFGWHYGWSLERFEGMNFDWITVELIPCGGNSINEPEYYRLKFDMDPEPDFMYDYENYYGYHGK